MADLPPLPKEVFDGEKYTAPVPRDEPLPNKCKHSQPKLISTTILRCSCGAEWTGNDISKLYKLLTS